jgi:hypothetical protein
MSLQLKSFTALLLAGLLLLSGCSAVGLRQNVDEVVPLDKAVAEIPDDQLLDVWIELFDPGELPRDPDDALGLSMDIRDAEARYVPQHLRNTMETTGYWGGVRVVPQDTEGAEVLVKGRILNSDGLRLSLNIVALDATGSRWFERSYSSEISYLAYQNSRQTRREPFQPIYNRIANDLAQHRSQLQANDARTIRQTAELRFAADLAPDAFRDYLEEDGRQHYEITRLPAGDDPMLGRVQAIRERDFLLIDTLNGHFDNFYRDMQQPYEDWRRTRSEEAHALEEIRREANTRKLLGFAAIIGAVALEATGNTRGYSSSVLRDAMLVGGAYAVKSGFDKASETEIHSAAIEELDDSFSAEARPMVVDVEGETHELTGSAEVQYTKWRTLLKRIYSTETGLPGAAN